MFAGRHIVDTAIACIVGQLDQMLCEATATLGQSMYILLLLASARLRSTTKGCCPPDKWQPRLMRDAEQLLPRLHTWFNSSTSPRSPASRFPSFSSTSALSTLNLGTSYAVFTQHLSPSCCGLLRSVSQHCCKIGLSRRSGTRAFQRHSRLTRQRCTCGLR